MSKEFLKAGCVKSYRAGDGDLEAINRYTLEPLGLDDVFTFEIAACDNDIDRAFEVIDNEALDDLAALYVGKTLIYDHERKAANQFARVYDAYVAADEGTTSYGMPKRSLVLRCYTRNCAANAEAIADIKAGIKKEVSVAFRAGSYVCSVCGQDNVKSGYCPHYAGRTYGGETCHFTYTEITDAYEVSFVAVPCQRNAGTRKDFEVDAPEAPPPDTSPADDGGGDAHEKCADDNPSEKAPDKGAFFMAKECALAEAYLTFAKGRE